MFERRKARIALANSIDIVSAYNDRWANFMRDKFVYEPKPQKNFGLFGSSYSSFNKNEKSPETHIIVVKEEDMKELLKLKKEFEEEFNIAQEYADVLKPQFFDDGAAAYDAKLKLSLQSSAWYYNIMLETVSKYEIYTKK